MAKSITDKTVVLFKYNGTPLPANAITAANTPFVKPSIKQQTYKDVGTGKLGASKTYFDENQTDTSFDIEILLRGSDKTGTAPKTAPKIAELLKAAGLTETQGTVDITYTPNHGYVLPSTCYVYQDDEKRSVTGAIADMKIEGSVGQAAKVTFSVQGFTLPTPAVETNPTVTLDTNSLMIVSKITAITLGGTALNITKFELSLNNETKLDYATAMSEFVRKDFAPKIKLSGIKTKGDLTPWTDLIATSVKEIIITLGSGAGKTVTITATQASTSDMEENDDNGTVAYSRTFDLYGDATGENQFRLKWS